MNKAVKAQINAGSLADMGTRFASAWKQAEAGETVNQTHITFLDVETMFETLSPRRLDLLCAMCASTALAMCVSWLKPLAVTT